MQINEEDDDEVEFGNTSNNYEFVTLYDLVRKELFDTKKSNLIHTPIKDLSFLGLSNSQGQLIEISGDKGSGKSQFSIWTAILIAIRYNEVYKESKSSNYSILIISSSKLSILEDRAKEIINNLVTYPQERVEVFNRLNFIFTYEIEEYETYFSLVENIIISKNIRTLIIDDLSQMCTKKLNIIEDQEPDNYFENKEENKNNKYNKYGKNLNGKVFDIISFIENHITFFKNLIFDYKMLIFITNSVSSIFKGSINDFKDNYLIYDKYDIIPKLGEKLTENINTRLLLYVDKKDTQFKRYGEIIFNSSGNLFSFTFIIKQEGISISNLSY